MESASLRLLVVFAVSQGPAVGAASAQAAPATEPAGHDRALAEVRAALDAGDAAEARVRLRALLDQPALQEWARAHRVVLLDEARNIAFRCAYVPPQPRDLVSGSLDEWVPRTGDIAVTYRPDTLADFVVIDRDVLVHPLAFRGDHGVDLRGTDFPRGGVRLLVAANAHASYCAIFAAGDLGDGARLEVQRLQAAGNRRVGATAPSPLRAGHPFRLGVRVGATSVRLLVDGKVVLQVDKDAGQNGQVGLWPTTFTELRIAGKASTSWLDGLRDAHAQAARARFEAIFDPADVLPNWLVAAPAPTLVAELAHYPCEVAPEHAAVLARCVASLEAQDWDACLRQTAEAARGDVPLSVVVWLRALAFAGKRAFEDALVCLSELRELAPDFARARELEARLLWGAGHRVQALVASRALVAEHPDDVDAVAALITFELCAGDREAAFSLQRRAHARGLRSLELERLARTLAKAERGPDWPRRHSYRSVHYEVCSDIDQRTCIEVASTLEESLATLCAELGGELDQFGVGRVFVFAGESSYTAYLDEVSGTVPIHTSGLYSRALRQLLLWQTPDRKRMLQTARHEGVHQYLDRVMPEPPRWFDEGLAQYYEMRTARGTRVGAALWRATMLRRMAGRRPVPLAEFLRWSAAEFYAQPELAYGQSWALVSMLRDGTHGQRALLDEVFAGFAQGRSLADTMASTLTPACLRELDAALGDWLGKQR
ncbi:MAG: DUF1570 domain-containing protein [Planctomycetota bacterium]